MHRLVSAYVHAAAASRSPSTLRAVLGIHNVMYSGPQSHQVYVRGHGQPAAHVINDIPDRDRHIINDSPDRDGHIHT